MMPRTEPRVEGVRSRTITWTDPARVRFRLRGLDGYEQLAAMKRGDASPPPAVACSDCRSTSSSAVAPSSPSSPTSCTRTRWARCTAASSRRSSTPRWVARSRRRFPADAGFTTLELSTNFVRAITQSTGRVHAEGRVVHSGGRVVTTEARVYDDAGTLYAHAKSTCLVLRRDR